MTSQEEACKNVLVQAERLIVAMSEEEKQMILSALELRLLPPLPVKVVELLNHERLVELLRH